MQPLSLRRNFSWTFIGRVVYAGSQWAMLMVLAKWMNPESVGEFVYGFAVTAPAIMFANLQLRLIQATDPSAQYSFRDYLGLRILSTGLAILVIIGIALISDIPSSTAIVVCLIGIAKAIEAISDIFFGYFQRVERMDRIAWSQILKGILSLVGLTVGIHFSGRLIWGIIGLILAWFLSLLIYDIPNVARLAESCGEKKSGEFSLRPNWHFPTLKALLVLSAPLGFVTLLRSLNANIPRYFIEDHLGLYELGIFGALAYIIAAERRLTQALGQAASPRLAQHFIQRDRMAFRRLLLKLTAITGGISFAGFVLILIAGKEILNLLYNVEYARFANLFALLALAAVFDQVVTLLGYALTTVRKLVIQLPLDILNLTTLTIACMVLIPNHGLNGAVAALLLSNLIGLGASIIVVLNSLRDSQQSESSIVVSESKSP